MKTFSISLSVRTCLLSSLVLLGATQANAASQSFAFERVTYNSSEDISGQLSITVWDYSEANSTFGLTLDSSQILFTVYNNVGISSSVSEVFFDDGLLGPSLVENSLGGYTDFSGGGSSPGNLPGGNSIGFEATQEFSADAVGNPIKGVDSSDDILGIILGLGGFADYNAVIAAVNAGSLRFGYHVRAIGADCTSDGFVNTVVPVPAAAWLFGSALLGLAGLRHRK